MGRVEREWAGWSVNGEGRTGRVELKGSAGSLSMVWRYCRECGSVGGVEVEGNAGSVDEEGKAGSVNGCGRASVNWWVRWEWCEWGGSRECGTERQCREPQCGRGGQGRAGNVDRRTGQGVCMRWMWMAECG